MILLSMAIFACTTLTAQDFKYIGAAKCKMCHNKPDKVEQYKKWAEGPHANAMKVLSAEEANTQVSFGNDTDGDGVYDKDVTYRFDSSTTPGILYYDDNITGSSYVLCENVTAATFNRTDHQIDRDNGAGGVVTIWAVRDVRIVLTLTDETGDISQTLAAATLIRKNQ